MNAPRPLLPLDEALQRLATAAAAHRITETEPVSTFDARGRVLAAAVRATIAVPGADNSAMDGYAMRAADVPAAGTVLPVSQRIAAGHVGQALQPGTAARIFTGALVPAGADAVVMQEQCEPVEGGAAVRVNTVPAAGLAIRRRGEDVAEGAEVLAAGTRLSPQALGLAASVGVARLPVLRRPRVAILCTGDELAMPGEPLRPGALYNSNRFTLRALAEAAATTSSSPAAVSRWARKTTSSPPRWPRAGSRTGSSPSSLASRWPLAPSAAPMAARPCSWACPATPSRRS